AGDPVELAGEYRALRQRQPQINVLGGCCGTDHRHIEHIARACHGCCWRPRPKKLSGVQESSRLRTKRNSSWSALGQNWPAGTRYGVSTRVLVSIPRDLVGFELDRRPMTQGRA